MTGERPPIDARGDAIRRIMKAVVAEHPEWQGLTGEARERAWAVAYGEVLRRVKAEGGR